ncbi:MAG: cysteine desulfurase [Candidatus Marinimicrobia bacterium]|nr:cysteine desulfurase [Candidatus Neomarinimicrobiota bacterium]
MTTAAPLDPADIRPDFPLLDQRSGGQPLAYLDNAATSQKPLVVIEAVSGYYRHTNANVHRGIYELANRSTEAYEGARRKAAQFINADDWRSVIFTSGTTEAINLVAHAWGRQRLGSGDEIVLSISEHHSNLVPWQLVAKATGAKLRHIPLGEHQGLDLEAAAQIIGPRTKLVALGHQSNVLGNVNPVKQIIAMAKDVGALVLLDGAQSAPHFPVDVQALGCDFYAFSGHKMLGPTGIGVLWGRRDILEEMEPFLGGGEMIHTVTLESSTWNELPWKFEAGTPKIAQAVGLGAAIDYLTALGMDRVQRTIDDLSDYAARALGDIPGITLFGDAGTRSGALSFAVEGVHPHDMAQLLDQEGIAVRAGHHCAQPLMQLLGVASTTRASFQIYNTVEEIDRLAAGIRKAAAFMQGA